MMLCASALPCLCSSTLAQGTQTPFVHLAELEIDAAHLEKFTAATKDHAAATLGAEAGVIAFHAAAKKDNPTRVLVFEMYVNASAYRAHLETPHFQSFRAATDKMIASRKLVDTLPVVLGAKPELSPGAHVRMAELEIDAARLDAYKAAVAEEIEASIRLEPGVLAIYSVALKDHPTQLRFFEIYADESAYRQHIESPHFRKYVDATKPMITARRLFEMEPLFLAMQ